MKIGIVVGSIREGRLGESVGAWAKEIADQRDGDVSYELLDLKAFDLPRFTASVPPMMANKSYDDERVRAWSAAIDACDAYVFVTPEYNHSFPGAFKDAFDSLGAEWSGKAVGFVGYGAASGVRAIESWRPVVANFSMYDVRAEVNLSIFTDVDANGFAPGARQVEALQEVFAQVEAAAARLSTQG